MKGDERTFPWCEPIPKPEYITSAAIWYKELPTMDFLPTNIQEGMVIQGHRHCHCINVISHALDMRTVKFGERATGETEQGFITSKNRFVDRKEAGEIAFACGQISKPNNYLFSEDIY